MTATPPPADVSPADPTTMPEQEQDLSKTANDQPREPVLPLGESVAACDDTYEVRVSLTVAIPYRGKHPGINDALEDVIAALRGQKSLPDGSHLHGGIVARVRTAKEIVADKKRADARNRRKYP